MVLPNSVVPSLTVTVLLASAEPCNSGEALLMEPVGATTVGANGATVSTTNESTVDGEPVFLAASVAVALMLCVPSDNVLTGVNVQ